jgi:antitoxin HicB
LTSQNRYPKQVFWSDEDEGFIAIAPDLPGCSAFGETEHDAISELDEAIVAWIAAAETAGNVVPTPSKPAEQKEFSGKVLVRMPRELHRCLADAAHKDDVSLNQYIVFLLTKNWVIEEKRSYTTANATISKMWSHVYSNVTSVRIDETSSAIGSFVGRTYGLSKHFQALSSIKSPEENSLVILQTVPPLGSPAPSNKAVRPSRVERIERR